ncbi:hypothetical protein HMPREF0742_00352 [Rothia aeria F0184]|uniref:Uncharacterized protein n=1 Tax=Rothia aeria F0184 TaxID=888019 RepID=U7V6W5_9MICC|nr:hypothetical protein HMPREF0742_00352 [Rothia aeria F0184]
MNYGTLERPKQAVFLAWSFCDQLFQRFINIFSAPIFPRISAKTTPNLYKP